MKRSSLIVLPIVFFSRFLFGQNTVLITHETDSYYEEYSVLEHDRGVKHGPYIKIMKRLIGPPSIESRGTYENGKKSGYWEHYYLNFRHSNNIEKKGFYIDDVPASVWVYYFPQGTSRKLVTAGDNNTLKIVDAQPVVSKTGKLSGNKYIGEWKFYNEEGELMQRYDYNSSSLTFIKDGDLENHEAGFPGGDNFLRWHLFEVFDFRKTMESINTKVRLRSGKLIFTFRVGPTGAVTDIINLEKTISNRKIYERAVATIESLSGLWFPRKLEGVAVASEKRITFDLVRESNWTVSPFDRDGSFWRTVEVDLGLTIKIE